MTVSRASNSDGVHHTLWFRSLNHEGRALVFPCNSQGQVDMDSLSEQARCNYLFARRAVGRDFAQPSIQASH